MPYDIQITRKDGKIVGTTVPGDLPAVGTIVRVRIWNEIITAKITHHPEKPPFVSIQGAHIRRGKPVEADAEAREITDE